MPVAAQTAAPEDMVLIPAGTFRMGRTFTIFLDAKDLMPPDKKGDPHRDFTDLKPVPSR